MSDVCTCPDCVNHPLDSKLPLHYIGEQEESYDSRGTVLERSDQEGPERMLGVEEKSDSPRGIRTVQSQGETSQGSQSELRTPQRANTSKYVCMPHMRQPEMLQSKSPICRNSSAELEGLQDTESSAQTSSTEGRTDSLVKTEREGHQNNTGIESSGSGVSEKIRSNEIDHFENSIEKSVEASNIAINPKHYREHPSGVECITITEAFNFNLGNAIKYIWRAGLKDPDPITDLRKAIWYIEREISRRERSPV